MSAPHSNSSIRLAATRTWLLVALVCIVPAMWGQGFALRFGAEILLIGTAVMSLNLLIGLGGLVSLGHGAVFGCAAYAAAVAAQTWGGNVVLVLAVGVLIGMAVAGLMALLTLRSTGLFFLVLTLVAGQMAWEVVFRWREVTGGADGLRGFPGLDAFGIRLDTPAALYVVACVIAGLAWWVLCSFARAPVGLALQGMRDQPLRMRALGYSLGNLRVRAFLVSGAVAGAAGALFPFVNQYIGPNTVHWSMSATLVIMSVLGGIHVLLGGFAGAAVYLLAQTQLSAYTDRWQLAIGLLFVATVMFAPNGLLRLGRRGRP